jgi:signal transduction histidine kinase
MRWSIRNQILIPLIAIQAVAMAATTITTATLAARRSQQQIVDRLNGVIDALGHANFPYTGSVLARMRGLSGAQFVAYAEDGRVTGSSLPNLEGLPPALRSLPSAGHLDSLGEFPTAILEGTRFVGVSLRSSGGPRGTSLLVLYPEAGWRQARWEATMPPLILGAGSLGVMVLVTSWIAHRIGVRLRRVQRQVARIVEGEFQELPLGGERDEVEDLSRSINHMCVQLKNMQRTIGETERSRLLAQLAAGLAHQLRNALTGARLSVQLHAKRYPAPGDDQTLSVALRQLAMTEEQVKGLLSLGRVESRPPTVCDLRQLLAEVAFLVHPACQHAGVALRQPAGGRPLEVLADPSGVRAALLNLTLNAIEAAGAGGSVRLEAIPDGDEAAVEVADTGAGPPPELADSLCEAFVTSKPEGVGLGLALAHRVASDHGGRLSWLRTEGETRFRLTLPMRDGSATENGSTRLGDRPGLC